MDRIDTQTNGRYWEWLTARPEVSWLEIADTLDVPAAALVRKVKAVAPSRTEAAAEGLLREFRAYFPQGWRLGAGWTRVKMLSIWGSMFDLDDSEVRSALAALDACGEGWRPAARDDVLMVIKDHFEE